MKLMQNQYYVYILASKKNGTLYIGVTNDLKRRVGEHKANLLEGFTKKYSVHDLVYFESYNDIMDALIREKRLKKWNREWKIKLIKELNSEWRDLYDDLF
jgi:putative endonuclease